MENKKKKLEEAFGIKEESLEELNELQMNNLIDIIQELILIPEEQFDFFSKVLIESVIEQFQNPTERIRLIEEMRVQGITVSEVIESYRSLYEEILKLEIDEHKKQIILTIPTIAINALLSAEQNLNKVISIPIELCRENAKPPMYANIGDAGADVYACEDYTIEAGETMLVPAGFKMAIPIGWRIAVRPRSGQSLRTKLRIANSPGTIDHNYSDEVGIIIENTHPSQPYIIEKGNKFAQLVLEENPTADYSVVKDISIYFNKDKTRTGGFGSTGK